MPEYQYTCSRCGKKTERIRKMSERRKAVVCDHCGSLTRLQVRKQLHAIACPIRVRITQVGILAIAPRQESPLRMRGQLGASPPNAHRGQDQPLGGRSSSSRARICQDGQARAQAERRLGNTLQDSSHTC